MAAYESGKTYFVVSDVHSFYTPLKKALAEAGYDKGDENHILISLGDVFDRGDETLKMLKFLKSIPKERRILVRGNHELLLKECYRRGMFFSYDESNGTALTMCHFCGIDPNARFEAYKRMFYEEGEDLRKEYDDLWEEYLTKPFDCRRTESVIDWIDSDEWVNYYELGDFLFVHSWVPVEIVYDDGFKGHERPLPNWREADAGQWEEAMWGCPWKHYLAGSLPEGKTIVCGHWHVQDFHTHLGHDVDGYKNREIFHGDHLIALDACTAMSPHLCNVLVIKDGRCYDKHQNALD